MDWTPIDELLSTASLRAIGVFLWAAATAAMVLGRLARRRIQVEPDRESDSILISSVLGLLALILSFTFALATDRYEARRLLVQEEANAIGTMYLRAQLLEEPHRGEIRRILVRYTQNRVALGRAKQGEGGALLETNDALLREFWTASAAAFPSIRDLDFSSTFYDSANLVVELDATRKSARMAHVPTEVFALLFIYVIVGAGVLGFFAASPRALRFAGLFLLLLVMFLVVILDIDRPTIGGIRESQGPMERLAATLSAN
jgi:hypothetical protein